MRDSPSTGCSRTWAADSLKRAAPNISGRASTPSTRKNGVSDLVFWDLDRFTRNIQHFFTDTEKLLNAGINLHLASESEEYNYHTQEKWHARVLAAQAESRRIAKRTKRGQRKATEEGRHIGKPPWGYILVYESDELDEKGNPVSCGRLEPDPELWPHVLKLWDIAKDGFTPMKIAQVQQRPQCPISQRPTVDRWDSAVHPEE